MCKYIERPVDWPPHLCIDTLSIDPAKFQEIASNGFISPEPHFKFPLSYNFDNPNDCSGNNLSFHLMSCTHLLNTILYIFDLRLVQLHVFFQWKITYRHQGS